MLCLLILMTHEGIIYKPQCVEVTAIVLYYGHLWGGGVEI